MSTRMHVQGCARANIGMRTRRHNRHATAQARSVMRTRTGYGMHTRKFWHEHAHTNFGIRSCARAETSNYNFSKMYGKFLKMLWKIYFMENL